MIVARRGKWYGTYDSATGVATWRHGETGQTFSVTLSVAGGALPRDYFDSVTEQELDARLTAPVTQEIDPELQALIDSGEVEPVEVARSPDVETAIVVQMADYSKAIRRSLPATPDQADFASADEWYAAACKWRDEIEARRIAINYLLDLSQEFARASGSCTSDTSPRG